MAVFSYIRTAILDSNKRKTEKTYLTKNQILLFFRLIYTVNLFFLFLLSQIFFFYPYKWEKN